MDSKNKQMKELQKLPQYIDTYKALKPVFDGLKKIKFDKAKEKYKAEHAKLEQEYEAAYKQFKTVRSDSQTLWKIKSHVDTARQNMERKQEQNNQKRQEQEI